MKKIIASLTVLLLSCATPNNPKYRYSGKASKAECESQCASYGYPLVGLSSDGGCVCNTRQCMRPKMRGGCEQLPITPDAPATQSLNPDRQM